MFILSHRGVLSGFSGREYGGYMLIDHVYVDRDMYDLFYVLGDMISLILHGRGVWIVPTTYNLLKNGWRHILFDAGVLVLKRPIEVALSGTNTTRPSGRSVPPP